MPDVITRFAPSPTGHLHVGGARTALFCWAFARRHGGRFILRIEDTDQARSSDESARGIMEDLAWLGIDWDEGPTFVPRASESSAARSTSTTATGGTIGGDPRNVGPFFQARRVHLYNRYIMRLVEEEKAYPAFDTPEELDAMRRAAIARKETFRYDRTRALSIPRSERLARMKDGVPHVIRLVAPAGEIIVHDEVLGDVRYAPGEADDFVLRKADGFPTYHFAVVVDDELMGVTHVMRAQEHLNNTPRHVALQRALGFRTPVYSHMPLIFNMDGSKMSKRDKAKAARAALKSAMQKDPTIDPGTLAAELSLDATQLADFIAAENDNTDIAGAVARRFNITLPEIEVSDFRENGYLPGALTNFLALLGWNPGMKLPDGKDLEKFDTGFLSEHFSIERIGRTNAKFDRAKLLSFNADAINSMREEDFGAAWRSWCTRHDPRLTVRVPEADRWAILSRAVKARAKTFRDGSRAASFVIRDDDSSEFDTSSVEKTLLANGRAGLRVLSEFQSLLRNVTSWTPEVLHAAIESYAQSKGFLNDKGAVNVGPVAQPVRIAVAGAAVTPPLGETLAVLGKDSTLARMSTCIQFCARF